MSTQESELPRVSFPTREILGVQVVVAKRQQVIDYLLSRLAERKLTRVCFANAHFIMSLINGHDVRSSDRFLVLNDGIALDLASLITHGCAFPENLNGSDFTPALLAALPSKTRVFLYGATAAAVSRTAEVIGRRYKCEVCGFEEGFSQKAPEEIARVAKETSPDVILVALGNPKQEYWIAQHAESVGAPLLLGVGAFFDFASGVIPRAPVMMRRLRLEWLYRWSNEPGRLRRRYTIEFLRFFTLVLRQRAHRRRSLQGG